MRINTESQFKVKKFSLLILEVSGSAILLLFFPFCNRVNFPLPPSSDNNHHPHILLYPL